MIRISPGSPRTRLAARFHRLVCLSVCFSVCFSGCFSGCFSVCLCPRSLVRLWRQSYQHPAAGSTTAGVTEKNRHDVLQRHPADHAA